MPGVNDDAPLNVIGPVPKGPETSVLPDKTLAPLNWTFALPPLSIVPPLKVFDPDRRNAPPPP